MTVKNLYPDTQPSLSLDFANTKALDPRVTFARASTARFYDGRSTAKAEENLLIRSQEFDNTDAWVPIRTSISANAATAPDGTSTAESLVENTETNTHFVQPNTSSWNGVVANGSTYTFSVFAKANTRTEVRLGLFDGSTTHSGFFNLSTGVVISSSGVTASISDAGNGWYRCVVVRTNTNTTMALSIGPSVAGNDLYTGDGVSGIFIWGAQLEQRSSVTAYTPTTTQPITNYVPVLQSAANNVARFDHNPVTGESLGLLIEEQRTNLLVRSEEFDNASWGKTGETVITSTIIAPDGTLTGSKIVRNLGNSTSFLSQVVTTTATAHTGSVFAKAGEKNHCSIVLRDGSTNFFALFDLVNGTVGDVPSGSTASITPVGNGWYRCTHTRTFTGTSNQLRIYSAESNSSIFYTGDGFSGIYIWGAQLEAGAFPTSYIPTVASQVTRSADAASMTGANFSSWYRADEGTMYAEVTSRTDGVILVANDGSFANRLPQISVGSLNTYENNIVANNSLTASIIPAGIHSFGTFAKMSCAYRVNDCAAVVNGGSAAANTSVILPSGISQLNIGTFQTGSFSINGTIKKIAFYPKRLANAELQALTQN